MLLAVDVGNTHSTLGLFDGSTLIGDWRIATSRSATGDELAVTVTRLLELAGHSLAVIDRLAVASVVPALVSEYRDLARRYLGGGEAFVVDAASGGMRLDVETPEEVGADRIINAVAAYERYGSACIVLDMGTATTYDAISADGAYLGGAIAPGLGISVDALVARAARLASVELAVPAAAIGRNTVTSTQSGVLFGTIAQAEGMLARFRAELQDQAPAGGHIPAVATGGLAPLIAPWVTGLDDLDPLLTLRGIQLVASRTSPEVHGDRA